MNKKQNKRVICDIGVIFDLDGVIVDTSRSHKQSWDDLSKHLNLPFMTEEFFCQTFGMQNVLIIPKWLGKELPQEEIKRLSDWKENRFREILMEGLDLLPGVQKLLLSLRDNNIRTAIGTSTPKENLDLILKSLRIEDYFDVCVTCEDIVNGKPAPDTFLKAAERLVVSPENCIVIEDAPQGIEAAKAAGMYAIAITTTRRSTELAQADLIVDKMTELEVNALLQIKSMCLKKVTE